MDDTKAPDTFMSWYIRDFNLIDRNIEYFKEEKICRGYLDYTEEDWFYLLVVTFDVNRSVASQFHFSLTPPLGGNMTLKTFMSLSNIKFIGMADEHLL